MLLTTAPHVMGLNQLCWAKGNSKDCNKCKQIRNNIAITAVSLVWSCLPETGLIQLSKIPGIIAPASTLLFASCKSENYLANTYWNHSNVIRTNPMTQQRFRMCQRNGMVMVVSISCSKVVFPRFSLCCFKSKLSLLPRVL